MNARRLLITALVVLVPTSSMAQLDDFLTPLAPQEEKKETKKKKRVTKKKRGKAREAKEKEAISDPVVVPLVQQKTELLVKVSGPQSGAQVSVDGRDIPEGQKVEVEPGEHTVIVKRVGFADYRKNVRLKQGETLEVTAIMDAVSGVLTVTADVPGSTVILDGAAIGEAPVRDHPVQPGSHTVIVRREGFEDSVSNLAVRAGRDYTVKGNLKPLEGGTRTLVASNADRPEATRLVPEGGGEDNSLGLTDAHEPAVESSPWYGRWYVWAGVGAVAAAAVTSAVVVSSNGSGGTLSPNTVCGGPCDEVINAPAGALRF